MRRNVGLMKETFQLPTGRAQRPISACRLVAWRSRSGVCEAAGSRFFPIEPQRGRQTVAEGTPSGRSRSAAPWVTNPIICSLEGASDVRYRVVSVRKKIARRVFEAALDRELAEVMAAFKDKAVRSQTPEDMWAVRQYLERAQHEIDSKYDYRYSQLDFVLGRLLREKRIGKKSLLA